MAAAASVSGAIEAIRRMRPELERVELVHRLDRDTSGCLADRKKARLAGAHARAHSPQSNAQVVSAPGQQAGSARRYPPSNASDGSSERCDVHTSSAQAHDPFR